jgi:hypothetical protein
MIFVHSLALLLIGYANGTHGHQIAFSRNFDCRLGAMLIDEMFYWILVGIADGKVTAAGSPT